MKKTEAMQIIKAELGEKAEDKRTKLNKAVTLIEDFVKWDEARLEKIIDETIQEFEEDGIVGFTD